MIYADARARIKTGDMLLWRDHAGGGLRAVIERWLVRHGTASPYTHVGVAWCEHGRVWTMDMTTKGCAPRPLSGCLPFDWIPAPVVLSDDALDFAISCFGEWEYSRWQALLAFFKALAIGADRLGECAEYALAIWNRNMIPPTTSATPEDCAYGGLSVWGSSLQIITGDDL